MNCDLCDSSDYKSIEAARDYIGDQEPPVVCMGCGFVYVRERRSQEEVAKAWDDIWGDGYTSSWPAVKARLTYVTEWLDENVGLEGKSVLDIGAGEGKFLELVKVKGAHPVGIEPFRENVLKIRSKDIACFYGTAESVEPGEYDIVTVNWTLENTGDCIGFLKRARSFLKKDGVICVATGSRILVPFKKPLSVYFSKNPQDTHCFRFSALSLGRALMISGFCPKEKNRFGDCDWLVWLGGKLPEETSVTAQWNDNPKDVLAFFEMWKAAFP